MCGGDEFKYLYWNEFLNQYGNMSKVYTGQMTLTLAVCCS